MDKECSIVRDLLPLYAEDLVGAETAEFVAAHIAACPDCEKEYEAMKSGAPVPAEPQAEAAPLKSIKKVIIKKRVRAVILAVALAAALFVTAFAFLTTREYLSYEEAIISVVPGEGNMSADVTFSDCVTGYDYTFTYEPETDTSSSGMHGWVCRFEAWTTPWDRLFKHKASPATIARNTVDADENGSFSVIFLNDSDTEIITSAYGNIVINSIDGEGNVVWKAVSPDEDTSARTVQAGYVLNTRPFSLYYCPNDGGEDVFIFGLNRTSERGFSNNVTLPRLTLNYYFYGAVGLLMLLIAATAIFRKNETAQKWLLRCAFLPASYVAAHLIVKGFGGASYSLMRDLSLILLITVLLFCALLTAHSIFLLKKEAKSV